MIEFKYRADVDGLRAIAVALVLLFHADLDISGGFIGVDVFFVISGFLITGLILKEQQTEGFHLSQFWIRRVRRILPVSTFVVMATLLAGFFILLPIDYSKLAKSTIAQQLLVSNFFFFKNTGYFEGSANEMPLLHTWSLAVEEQFYMLYPFLLMLLSYLSRQKKVRCLVAVTVLSFALCEWVTRPSANASFYLLPYRAWELLLGGLLCFAPSPSILKRWMLSGLSWLGIAGILIAAYSFDHTTRFPGLAALLPCVATAMVIYANSRRLTSSGMVLASSPFVYVGLRSYSLYLWHWPLLALLRAMHSGAEPDLFSRLQALAASFALAELSYRFIEQPFRRKLLLPQPSSLLKAYIGSIVLLLACSLLIIASGGVPTRFDARTLAYASAAESKQFTHEISLKEVQNGKLPHFGYDTGCRKCLIWGDSFAMAMTPGLDAACKSYQVKGFQATRSTTPPIMEFQVKGRSYDDRTPASTLNEAITDFVIEQKIDVVVMVGFWSIYEKNADFEQQLIKTCQKLTKAGIQVAIVQQIANQPSNVPQQLSMAVRLGHDVEKIGVPLLEYQSQNKRCLGIINRLSDQGVIVLDPSPYFVDQTGLWRAELNGVSMYRDKTHLSVAGSLHLKPMFERLFESMDRLNRRD
ncbi:MAG TPA: acyltransferase family protein [Gemmatales bacterium]|nr:acyltransferase family protein [Gemmatales bacterium]